eukprot:g2139.t1
MDDSRTLAELRTANPGIGDEEITDLGAANFSGHVHQAEAKAYEAHGVDEPAVQRAAAANRSNPSRFLEKLVEMEQVFDEVASLRGYGPARSVNSNRSGGSSATKKPAPFELPDEVTIDVIVQVMEDSVREALGIAAPILKEVKQELGSDVAVDSTRFRAAFMERYQATVEEKPDSVFALRLGEFARARGVGVMLFLNVALRTYAPLLGKDGRMEKFEKLQMVQRMELARAGIHTMPSGPLPDGGPGGGPDGSGSSTAASSIGTGAGHGHDPFLSGQ